MKRLTAVFIAVMMIVSVPFVGTTLSNGDSMVSAQVVRKSKRRGRYVTRKTWNGSRWVYTKVRVKTKSPRRKTWRTGRKVVSRSKKAVF